MIRRPPRSPLFPYTPPFRSHVDHRELETLAAVHRHDLHRVGVGLESAAAVLRRVGVGLGNAALQPFDESGDPEPAGDGDRKSTRLNSSHANISYAVFCLKKK